MPHTLHFKSHFLLSEHFLLLNSVVKTNTSLQSTNFAPNFPSIDSSFSLSLLSNVQKRVIHAKKSRRRSGYQRPRKFMLQLISIFASNLNILPHPLDLVIEEFNGGNGGGLRFLKGFGGGGFGRWRRGKKGNLGFLTFSVILGSLFLLYGKEVKSDVICGGLGLGLSVIVFFKGFKRNVKDWIFGLWCFCALMGLGWRREEAMKWVHESRVRCPMVEIFTSKRKGRRAL